MSFLADAGDKNKMFTTPRTILKPKEQESVPDLQISLSSGNYSYSYLTGNPKIF